MTSKLTRSAETVRALSVRLGKTAFPAHLIDRVCQSYFCRIASIPSIFGEAHLLHRTVACERRERGRAGVVAVAMISSPGIDSFGISINSRTRAAISSGGRVEGEMAAIDNVNLR